LKGCEVSSLSAYAKRIVCLERFKFGYHIPKLDAQKHFFSWLPI
jgi:hypothetical protein